ncbi:acyl-CoA thioesterase [Maricaulis sp.]|uniref:acyl-CoA thioesterase n=1 Tax=Maricaulis sp. TaxID=1486257 RepID=UPI003A937E36
MSDAASLQVGLILPGEGQPGEGLGCVDFDSAFCRTVEPGAADIDQLGHVNNVVYLRWVQDIATTHWFTVAPTEMVESEVWVALKHVIEYRDPILPGESAEIRTWLGEVRGPRFDRHVDIRKPGAKRFSARATTEWCRINAATRRPMRIGRDVLDIFQVPG